MDIVVVDDLLAGDGLCCHGYMVKAVSEAGEGEEDEGWLVVAVVW